MVGVDSELPAERCRQETNNDPGCGGLDSKRLASLNLNRGGKTGRDKKARHMEK